MTGDAATKVLPSVFGAESSLGMSFEGREQSGVEAMSASSSYKSISVMDLYEKNHNTTSLTDHWSRVAPRHRAAKTMMRLSKLAIISKNGDNPPVGAGTARIANSATFLAIFFKKK